MVRKNQKKIGKTVLTDGMSQNSVCGQEEKEEQKAKNGIGEKRDRIISHSIRFFCS